MESLHEVTSLESIEYDPQLEDLGKRLHTASLQTTFKKTAWKGLKMWVSDSEDSKNIEQMIIEESRKEDEKFSKT